MPRYDYETNSIIGAGEDATYNILQYLTGLKGQTPKHWGEVGIFRQIPLDWLLSKEEFDFLSPEQQKKSIDIVIAFKPDVSLIKSSFPFLILVRVQGKKGNLKLFRDGVQDNIILKNYTVVDIHLRECKYVFKEEVTERAIQEIRDSFKTARVDIPVFLKS